VATRGTQAAGASTSFEPAQAPVWGLGRVVSLEHPELWGGLVDLDDADADDAATRLLSQVAAPDGEDQIAWRGDQRHVARLTRAKEPVVQPVTLQPDASYLIVGGLGRLGLKVAQSLVEDGARHLVLMSRRGVPAGGDAAQKAEAIAALEAQGATVEVVAADVGDRARVQALIAGFGTTRPALRGVVHAAVSPAAEALGVMTLARLQEVYRPKVAGAFVLQELTAALPLDFFVLFSSTTGLLGVKGLGHYAGANTYLDTLAHAMRSAGRSAIAINWGVWDDVQMGSEEAQRALAGAGLRPMPTARALRVLQQLTGSALPQVVVAAADWSLLKAVYEAKKQRPFLEHVANLAPPAAAKRAAAAAPETGSLKQRLAEARPQDRYDALVEYIRGEVRQVLRLEAGQAIELQRGLFDLGLDSLMSVELKSRLEAGVGRSLPSTLTFNYPNVGALADYLAREVLQLTPPETTAVPVAGAVPVAETPVAVGPAGDELSEDELAAKLSERLGQMR
jgi:myxalamid-type polyketide synthase MxaE and MxaD